MKKWIAVIIGGVLLVIAFSWLGDILLKYALPVLMK